MKPRVTIGLGQVAGEMGDAARDEFPGSLIEWFGNGPGCRIRDETSDPFGQIFTKRLDRFGRAVDGNDCKLLRE